MNTYTYHDAKGVVVCGDIHGDFIQVVCKCCKQYGMTDTLIIIAGDCGFGFDNPEYYEAVFRDCGPLLERSNNWVVFIRGNHDNPAYFDGRRVDYERWRAIPDYSVLKACNHTILCVGGAISVDRCLRMGGTVVEGDIFCRGSYWSSEMPVYDPKQLEAITDPVDVVVTHTAPSFCEKNSVMGIQRLLDIDKSLRDDIKQERQVMDMILEYLKSHGHPVQEWIYGHYHSSWNAEIGGVKYRMLNIMELYQI